MTAVRKEAFVKAQNDDKRQFPAEVYEPHDDVTREGVALMRDRAEGKIKGRVWKHIKGSNLSNAW